MTNQSHTELAAQARRAVKSLEILDMENTAELMRQCAAALESPERVPLSDEQIEECWEKRWGRGTYSTVGRRLFFARAIERAHGIVTKESST